VAVTAAERIGLLAGWVRPIPIRAPFGDVAVHIEKAPRVRLILRDTQRDRAVDDVIFRRHRAVGEVDLTLAGIAEPMLITGRQRIACVEQRGYAGAAGVLPLGLGRQAIGFAFFFREP